MGGCLANGSIPAQRRPGAEWYSLVRSVVGTSKCMTSVSAWRLAPTTSLPTSANPIALIKNASRSRCSSTIDYRPRRIVNGSDQIGGGVGVSDGHVGGG